MSLTDAGKKMQGEETSILPRMFLSREAERLIRSFNSEAVYSQPVRIQRPARLPPFHGDGHELNARTAPFHGDGHKLNARTAPFHENGQELNARTTEINRKFEEDSLHTLRGMWREDPEELFISDRDVAKTILPLTETQASSSSAWRLSSTNKNSSPVHQTLSN